MHVSSDGNITSFRSGSVFLPPERISLSFSQMATSLHLPMVGQPAFDLWLCAARRTFHTHFARRNCMIYLTPGKDLDYGVD
jgi:hypothetical protein